MADTEYYKKILNTFFTYLQSILACEPAPTAPGSPCEHTRRTPRGTFPAAPWGSSCRHTTTSGAAAATAGRRQRHRLSRRRQDDTRGATPDLSRSMINKMCE